jgi:hypothetical protein
MASGLLEQSVNEHRSVTPSEKLTNAFNYRHFMELSEIMIGAECDPGADDLKLMKSRSYTQQQEGNASMLVHGWMGKARDRCQQEAAYTVFTPRQNRPFLASRLCKQS